MAHVRAGLARNASASLAVVGAVAFFAFGLPALDRSLPADRPLPAGAIYAVGGPVTVVPPEGAGLDLTRTRPAADRGTALFLVGGARFAVVVSPYDGTLADAVTRLQNKITKTDGVQVTGPTHALETTTGVPGVRGTYQSPGRFGEYAVFVHADVVVEATVSGSEAHLQGLRPAIDAALRSVSFGGGP
jgi:hypothetical protein